MKINVLTKKGEKTDRSFNLNEEIFESDGNPKVLRQVIHVHLLNTRTGTAKAKGRSEVSGTGRKPWGNNKMGRARTGDLRTPIYRGGGVSHGPVPMNYSKKVTKKMKAIALYIALSESASNGKFFVVEDIEIKGPRLTNEAAQIRKDLEVNANMNTRKTIVYTKELTESVVNAFRNLQGIVIRDINHLNAYDVVSASSIVVLESAMELLNDSKAKTTGEKIEKSGTQKKQVKADDVKSEVVREEVKVKKVKTAVKAEKVKAPIKSKSTK